MTGEKRRVLLTGGSGFIGRNLLESPLARKYDVLAPRHAELDLLDEDAVAGYLRDGRFHAVIHAAVKPGHRNAAEPGRGFYENTRMFFNLARNAGSFGRLLVIGSGDVYDARHYRPKMREEYFGEHVPADEHGFSGYVRGKYAEKAGNITDLRVFGIYGRYEDYAIRFVSNMICKALLDLPLTMKQNRRFDYLWAADLCPVLEHFIENRPEHRDYNVTPDSAVELLDLARLVLKVSGKDLPIRAALEGLGTEYSGDNARLKAEVQGLRFTPPEAGIAELYGWYEANRGSIDRAALLADK